MVLCPSEPFTIFGNLCHNNRHPHHFSVTLNSMMKFPNASVAASLVAITYLVFELWSSGRHYGSFLIEPNRRQYYDIVRTDVRPHFQLLENQVQGYIGTLMNRSFKEVEDPSRRSLHQAVRPKKFFTTLKSDRNYFLDEVTVVNIFRIGSEIRRLANQTRLAAVGQRLFVDDYNGKNGDVRGNLRYDIGYTAVNQTDASVVKGMFFPKRLKGCTRSAGFDGDLTLEHSLFRYGCYVKMMADVIQNYSANEGGDVLFADKKRDEWFGGRWADALLFSSLRPWASFDGLSCFGTGGTFDHRVVKTDIHMDKHNSRMAGEEHCPTYTEWVTVVAPGGQTLEVRIGINLYKKSCCDEFLRRLSVNDTIASKLEEPICENCNEMPLHQKFSPPTNDTTEWVFPADDDKDGHYSMYVNVLNDLGALSIRNRAMFIEALMTIPLTPASDGWYHNMMGVLAHLINGTTMNGTNVIQCYIDFSTRVHGSVSWGEFYRCQVSHRGKMSKRQMYQSAQNLDKILMDAEHTNDTKKIVKRMSAAAKNGGVHGVGQFYAQVILNIATKIGLLGNKCHIGNVTVSTSTATYNRLKELGVRSKSHAAEIVPYLVGRLGESPQKCENMVCELLRREYGRDDTKDYFVKGHKLVVVENEVIFRVDARGKKERVHYMTATYNDSYTPGVVWWEDDVVSFNSGPHEWDDTVISLKRRRIGSNKNV